MDRPLLKPSHWRRYVGEKIEKVTHEDVQKAANAAQPRMAAIMEEMIRRS